MIALNEPPPHPPARSLRAGVEAVSTPSFGSAPTHLLASRMLEVDAGPGSAGDGLGASPGAFPPPEARLRPLQRVGPYRLLARLGRGAQGRSGRRSGGVAATGSWR